MTATTEARVHSCACGCGRPLPLRRRTDHDLAGPCLKRWQRQGCPEGGPRPPQWVRRSSRTERLDRLEELFAAGQSYAQAAGELGLTVRSVEAYAVDLNKRKRERGEALAASLRPAVPLRSAVLWQDRAACRGHGELFFGPEGERLADRQAREAAAVTLCEFCPVRRECEVAGMAQEYGTWGGLTEAERAQRANHHQEERAA